MKCIVASCNHDSTASCDQGVSFYTFPSDPKLCEKWLQILGVKGLNLSNSLVCSDHFRTKDLFLIRDGQKLLCSDAVPIVQACRICFATNCKLYSMTEYKNLSQAYEFLSGLMIEKYEDLPPYVCCICARRLLNIVSFRKKTMQGHLLLVEVTKTQYITQEVIKIVNNRINPNFSVTHKKDHYDLNIVHEYTEIDNINDIDDNNIDNDNNVADNDNDIVNNELEDGMETRDTTNNIILEITKDLPKDDERNDKNKKKTMNKQILLSEIKIEDVTDDSITNENDDNIIEYNDNDINEVDLINNSNPVGVYIKSESINEEDEFINEMSDGDNLIIPDNNIDKRKNTTKCNLNSADDIIAKKSSTNAGHFENKRNETILSPIKVEKIISRDYNLIENEPRLKTVDLDKNYTHLVPREINKIKTKNRKRRSKDTDIKIFMCDICKKCFGHKGSIRKHMRIVHCNVKPFSCKICSKSFVIKSKLDRHSKVHSQKKKIKYTCKLCNQLFKCENNLNLHLRIHSGEKPYSCHICATAYKDKRDLRKHLIRHSGVKPYTCDICKKAFGIKNKLIRHMKIHTGEKPYTCKICKKSFSEKSYLTRHLKIHSDIKPHICIVCNRTFSEKAVLNNHLRVHTGEKPYSCSVCSKPFTNKCNMVKHFNKYCAEKPLLLTIKKEPDDV